MQIDAYNLEFNQETKTGGLDARAQALVDWGIQQPGGFGWPGSVRAFTAKIKFNKSFSVPPTVVLSTSWFETNSNGVEMRWSAEVETVAVDSFILRLRVWDSTLLYSWHGGYVALTQ